MSLTVEHVVWCDNCENFLRVELSRGVKALQHAKSRGWIRTRAENKAIDLCPLCKPSDNR